MGRRAAAAAPVAVSLLVHGAVAAALLAALAVAGSAPRRPAAPLPVNRAPESDRRLVLEDASDAGVAIPLDTADPRFRPYLQGVKERIVARWEAPGAAVGDADPVVEFVIARDGSLAGCELAGGEATGGPAAAALGAVRRASPFPPLPPGMGRETLRVRARFVP